MQAGLDSEVVSKKPFSSKLVHYVLNSSGAVSALAVKASGPCGDDNGLNWLVFELLWRDFFRSVIPPVQEKVNYPRIHKTHMKVDLSVVCAFW